MARTWRLKSLLLILLQLTKVLLPHDPFTLPCVSSFSNPNSVLTNQLPRFNIPPGNLSYFRNPYWEVLYLLKFKTLPFHSSTSSSINRPLLQRIKSFLGSDGSNYYNREDASDSNFFLSGDSSEAFRDHEVSPVKKTNSRAPKSSRRSAKLRKYPRNSVTSKFKKNFPQASLMDEYNDYRNRKEHRVSKQTGENFDDRRIGGIIGHLQSLRPSSAESGLEMTINKKVNRKFQTQGWK